MTAAFPRLTLAALLAAGLTAGPALATKPPAKRSGSVAVYDTDGKLFSAGGIEKAKAAVEGTSFEDGLSVSVETHDTPPGERKAEAERVKNDPAKLNAFMIEWAKAQAKDDRAKGIYILINRHPGEVAVIAATRTRDRGFTAKDEQEVRDILLKGFRKAAKEPADKQTEMRDAALREAMEFVATDLKDTHVAMTGGHDHEAAEETHQGGFMSGIGGWLCIGLAALVGVWLVIGVVRAFSGAGRGGYGPGGGGMGGGGYGPGYGGGGGGGGFMSGMLGGLFGAVAGNYLYNNVFGGHTDTGGGAFGGGRDAYANDNSSSPSASDNDFSGDTGAAGGYDDSGDTGGGYDGGGGFDDGGGGGGYDGGGDFGGGDGGGGGDF